MPNQSGETLIFSSDEKFLLDSTGKKVKQYLDSAKAFVPMSAKNRDGVEFDPANPMKGEGHTFYPCNCRNECIAWDSQGKCIRTYRTCDICSK